jgi:hypothetical protein
LPSGDEPELEPSPQPEAAPWSPEPEPFMAEHGRDPSEDDGVPG